MQRFGSIWRITASESDQAVQPNSRLPSYHGQMKDSYSQPNPKSKLTALSSTRLRDHSGRRETVSHCASSRQYMPAKLWLRPVKIVGRLSRAAESKLF